MKILAIETSCDETAAAVLEVNRGRFNLLSNIVSSQIKIHSKYGGIIPEVAARKQLEVIIPVIEKSVEILPGTSIKSKLKNIDYLAVTQGPGLITSLTVGVETAKTLSVVLNKPLIPVNHLAGHIYANYLTGYLSVNGQRLANRIKFPVLCLVISGGHTLLVLMKDYLEYQVVGETQDDAVGEAFDKVAKILNLGYPGGPIISKMASQGDSCKFNLPRPMINQNNFNFSFSGLKTAVLYLTKELKSNSRVKQFNNETISNICASFQQAVIDVLITKTIKAAKKYNPKTILLGGGVAANLELRRQLQEKTKKEFSNIKIFMPELKFAGDNAAMIAAAAYFQIKHKTQLTKRKTRSLSADPNLTL